MTGGFAGVRFGAGVACAVAVAFAPAVTAAQAAPAVVSAQAAKAAPAAQPAASAAKAASHSASELRVIEDKRVRIEETRLRGRVQRITVAPKGAGGEAGAPAYEINVGAGGRDPSQDKSAAGQRVWSVLRF